MFCPNYREFYQISLVPIKELTRFSPVLNQGFDATHWLIALEGSNSCTEKEFYTWKVMLYPADAYGSFDWSQPHYTSPSMDSFDLAAETAKTLASTGQVNQLLALNLQERIS